MAAPERLLIPDRETGKVRPLAWGDICVLVRSVRAEGQANQAAANADGSFTLRPLPVEAQFAPVYASVADDFEARPSANFFAKDLYPKS